MKNIKIRYILKHKGKIKVVFATIEEIEQGKMDEYLMQKSEKFRSEDNVIARNLWTNNTDKNDKEIYSDDIIKKSLVNIDEEIIGIVGYLSHGFWIRNIKEHKKYESVFRGALGWCGLEVVGNIHQGLLPKYKHLENKFKGLKSSYGK